MKPLLLLLLATALTGCTALSRPPALAHIRLEAADDGRAVFRQLRLHGSPEAAVLSGQVQRAAGYSAARPLHVDVTLHDGAGQPPHRLVVAFHPQPIPRQGPALGGRAVFAAPLGPLAPSTTRIDVRLHGGEHPTDS